MDNRPIGVFDSGLGGLDTVKALKKSMPNENIIYLGDTGRIPYGTRSKETIQKYAMQDIQFLLTHDVKMIIAACGTVSANITQEMIDSLPVPFTGVMKPLAKASIQATTNNVVGVIATTASVKSGGFRRAIQEQNPDITVIEVACPLFVHLVENGLIEKNNPITDLTAQMYLNAFEYHKPDTLILGCTHFPLISHAIEKVMGRNVKLIEPGSVVATYIQQFLQEREQLGEHDKAQTTYFVTDAIENFYDTANMFLDGSIGGEVHLALVDK